MPDSDTRNLNLKAARAALGLTQAELAARVGVTRQTISMVESGDHNPTLSLCLAICWALNTDLNTLFWKDLLLGETAARGYERRLSRYDAE